MSFLARAAEFFGDRIADRARRARLHLPRVLRPRAAAGARAHQGRREARRHRGDPRRQHAGDAGGALRRADDRRGAEPDQHPPRRAADRLLPRARRGQAAAGRPRVSRHHRAGAGACWARKRPIVIDIADAETAGRAELRRASSTRTSSPRAIPPSPIPAPRTSGTASACSIPPAPPATPRAPSTAIAAPTSARSPTRSPSSSTTRAATCGRCRCSTARAGPSPGRSRRPAARTCACARSSPSASSMPSREHRVTHMCGAPIVLNMLVHAPADAKRPLPLRTKVATGGAAPPAIVIERMEAHGLRGAARLRHHRELRALHLLRADAGMAGAARGRALHAHGAPGHPQPADRAPDGRRPAHAASPCRGTGPPSARSC